MSNIMCANLAEFDYICRFFILYLSRKRCVRCILLESWLGYDYHIELCFSCFSPVASGKCTVQYLQLYHDQLLPCPSRFLIHLSPFHSTLCNLSCWWSKPKSKSQLYYDRQSVGQSALVSDTHLGPATNFALLSLIIFRQLRVC
jgi:hypothetical protein